MSLAAAPAPATWPPELLGRLSGVRDVLAVVAHPDDESFGLGGVIAALAETGRNVRVLCLTRGEASTLGASLDLASVRPAEFARAAEELGVTEAFLDDWPDAALCNASARSLDDRVTELALRADAVLVLEPSGITGHPDHQTASRIAAGVAERTGLIVLEWGLAGPVAAQLRSELGVPIQGLPTPLLTESTSDDAEGTGGSEAIYPVPVNRSRQWQAIRRHASQEPDNPLLARRLELSGDRDWVRLRPAAYRHRLDRFVSRVGPLLGSGATGAQRREVLDRLVGLAANGLPEAALPAEPAGHYTVRCLHDSPGEWSLAAVRTNSTGCTPPHDHPGWGAAATATGVERNRRFTGTCPDHLQLLDEQLAPVGGGYLFAEGDIHQACDASGSDTVSLHLLTVGSQLARQRCRESEFESLSRLDESRLDESCLDESRLAPDPPECSTAHPRMTDHS